MSYGNTFLKSLYYSSPNLVKSLLASAFGYKEARRRYGLGYREMFSFLKKSQSYSNADLMDYQRRVANEFVERALARSLYYQKPEYQDNWQEKKAISALPILSKEEVRSSADQIMPVNLGSISHRWAHTSGTTGKSMVFPLSTRCFQREYAFRALHYLWSGVDFDTRPRIATLAGHPVTHRSRTTPPFWMRDYWNNWLIFSSYHMTEETLKFYIEALEKFNPILIHGYPSSVYLLALAYMKYGRTHLDLRAVYTSSETLTYTQRQTIEEAFNVKTYNWYGNSEMVANIVECEKGELHLKLEHSYVEVLGEDQKPVKPGSTGRLVCTGFGNEAFPLIRYDVGDAVTLSTEHEARCGRGGVLIERVEGRVEDYIITPDGRYVGRLDHLFKDSRNVVEAQIYQDCTEEIVLRIVRSNAYSKDDEIQLVKEARIRLGDDIKIGFDYVSKIERTSNGKFKFIDSKLGSSNPFTKAGQTAA